MNRPVAGRINGVHAPVGSIMGPMWTDELLAVIEDDMLGDRVILGYATREELEADTSNPNTVAEFMKNRRAQLMQRVRLAALFGGDPT